MPQHTLSFFLLHPIARTELLLRMDSTLCEEAMLNMQFTHSMEPMAFKDPSDKTAFNESTDSIDNEAKADSTVFL